jgi:ligand-binding sensor domain-containing protein
MIRRPWVEAFLTLICLLQPGFAHADSCLFSQSALRASLTTEDGKHVELFDEFLRVDSVRLSVCNGLPGARPTAIVADGSSYLVGFRDEGLFRAVEAGFEPVASVPRAPIRALARVGAALYVAQEGPGLFRLENGVFSRVSNAPLHKRRIVALAAEGASLHVALDPTGHVRLEPSGKVTLLERDTPVGCFRSDTAGRLVARTPGPACEHPTRAGELPSAHVSALLQLDDELLVGSFDAGIVALSGTRVRAHFVRPRFVNALLRTPEGVYAAGPEGLYLATLQAGRVSGFERVPLPTQQSHVNDLARGSDGTLWLATSQGLLGLRAGQARLIDASSGLPSRLVYAVLVTDDGALWAGTARGAIRLGREGVQRFSTANGALKQDWVTALTVHRGQVIAGTYDAGSVELHADGTSRALGETSKLWVNPRGLFALDGSLLVASMGDGLMRDGTTVVGSKGLDVTALAADTGGLWVGTRLGLLRLAR